ncbi:MAG: tryptophan--tRNA ligase, partial [Clostridia bacterium]|nr:tryptophan--tRNA ligase [Clostridia bacterium]
PEYSTLTEMKNHYERGGLGDMKVKKFLNAVMQETLEPIRLRREEFAKDIPAVWDMLYQGSKEAKEKAADTLSHVKKAMKIDYFAGRN